MSKVQEIKIQNPTFCTKNQNNTIELKPQVKNY